MVEVEYRQRLSDGLWHAALKALHLDKHRSEVEEVAIHKNSHSGSSVEHEIARVCRSRRVQAGLHFLEVPRLLPDVLDVHYMHVEAPTLSLGMGAARPPVRPGGLGLLMDGVPAQHVTVGLHPDGLRARSSRSRPHARRTGLPVWRSTHASRGDFPGSDSYGVTGLIGWPFLSVEVALSWSQ